VETGVGSNTALTKLYIESGHGSIHLHRIITTSCKLCRSHPFDRHQQQFTTRSTPIRLSPKPKSIMRVIATSLLPTMLAVAGVFMAWKALALATHSPHPIIVVVSESMSPAFHRGDVCLVWNRKAAIDVGDIPVIWFQGRDLPMVHRAVESHWQLEDKTSMHAT
jgi:hypothetical protein